MEGTPAWCRSKCRSAGVRIKIGQTKFRKLLNEKNQFKELWNDAIEIIEENEKERKEIIHDVKI